MCASVALIGAHAPLRSISALSMVPLSHERYQTVVKGRLAKLDLVEQLADYHLTCFLDSPFVLTVANTLKHARSANCGQHPRAGRLVGTKRAPHLRQSNDGPNVVRHTHTQVIDARPTLKVLDADSGHAGASK
jgi:hypothetical protein